VVPPGELRVNAGVVWLAGNTVWSTPETEMRWGSHDDALYKLMFTFLPYHQWILGQRLSSGLGLGDRVAGVSYAPLLSAPLAPLYLHPSCLSCSVKCNIALSTHTFCHTWRVFIYMMKKKQFFKFKIHGHLLRIISTSHTNYEIALLITQPHNCGS